MEHKLLIAVDLSENSLRAVDYVGRMLACLSEAEITLLNVIRSPTPDVMPHSEERRTHVERVRQETLALLEEAGRRLVQLGIAEKNIHLKIQVCDKPVSVAELILLEQKQGKYETVVIGRRGVSKRQEFLFGSVSKRVVTEARDCVVWVVE